MGRVVREHYPVSKLPEDLRDDLDPAATVRVVIEEEVRAGAHSLEELIERARRIPPIGDDPTARIRALRDEWDR